MFTLKFRDIIKIELRAVLLKLNRCRFCKRDQRQQITSLSHSVFSIYRIEILLLYRCLTIKGFGSSVSALPLLHKYSLNESLAKAALTAPGN
ncbi:CLUMA_CG019706, isoform A [Clunio marinus]|uniref:CLUMA_CG019706, isoform A n=1 Tax=Clunio marinus TaxID=568069 RepID=A0A1J1J396_9DIPT|nr:CLUMA_CG019706, isoform A [Clunio marinus]